MKTGIISIIVATVAAMAATVTSSASQPIHPRGEGVNLRILDDNIWSNASSRIFEGWARLGADPRPQTRLVGFRRLVQEWMPDVITFQEYHGKIGAMFNPQLEELGYAYAAPEDSCKNNWTPIFYRPDVLEIVKSNYVLYTPPQWSDSGSKSFSRAVFRHKATGREFAVITTHLWWKGEAAKAGSNMARASQACLILAETERLRNTYGEEFPIFLTGDMNCTEASTALSLLLEGGYKECYAVATEFGDTHSGHHWCNGEGFGARKDEAEGLRPKVAIDHCLVNDGKGIVEIRRFDCVMDDYTLPLTDHYPNIVDASVR